MAEEKDPLGAIAKIDYDLALIERADVGWVHAAAHNFFRNDKNQHLNSYETALIEALKRSWPVVKAQARAILIERKDKVRAAGIATLREHLEKLEKGL